LDNFEALRMRRCLDQPAVHRRDTPGSVLLYQTPGEFDDPQILIYAPVESRSETEAGQPGLEEIAFCGNQDDGAGCREACRAHPATMPVKAANALQEHVHWTKIGEQEVRIEVERLFECLGPDHDEAAVRAIAPDLLLDGCVEHTSVLRSK